MTLIGEADSLATPPAVERVLAGPGPHRPGLRDDRVLVIAGGHRPGTQDRRQRDRARAQQPLGGPRRVVVLGCTVGAGQTTTTLMTGEVLASLRADPVAVLDLNPGLGRLAVRALVRPALSHAAALAPSRLEVLSRADPDGAPPQEVPDAGQPAIPDLQAGRILELASARYPLVLADPAAASLPRLLGSAHQLVLVAPASAAAADGIAMTLEWLHSHGKAELARSAVMVMNGVSQVTMPHIEHAELLTRGWCRAIVRIPWDDQLKRQAAESARLGPGAGQRWAGLLSPASVSAYTALAGLVVAGPSAAEIHGPVGSSW